jgi:hypothetical protein
LFCANCDISLEREALLVAGGVVPVPGALTTASDEGGAKLVSSAGVAAEVLPVA